MHLITGAHAECVERNFSFSPLLLLYPWTDPAQNCPALSISTHRKPTILVAAWRYFIQTNQLLRLIQPPSRKGWAILSNFRETPALLHTLLTVNAQ